MGSAQSWARVYPRVCGGTMTTSSAIPFRFCWGSIPACAGEPQEKHVTTSAILDGLSPRVRGNPTRLTYGLDNHEVYPRVCGGTAPPFVSVNTRAGLSPRVRGNRMLNGSGPAYVRSIPRVRGNPPV